MGFYIKRTLLIILIISSFSEAQNYGTWSLTDSLNVPREDAASVELADGNILVTGGSDSLFIRSAEIYNYKLKKWENIDQMIVGRVYHRLLRLNNGNILAIGGYNIKSCEIYDTTTKAWSLTDSLNYERSYGETTTLLDSGNVLVAGGFYLRVGNAKDLRACEFYVKNTSKWMITDSLKIARHGHTATKLLDGRVLVAGGFSYIQKELSECEIYDPAVKEWTEVAPLNIARYNHSATLLPSGKVLVTGGLNYASPTNPWLNSCELYDPVENTWTIVDSLFVPHTLHSSILLKNGLLLIAGGSFNSNFWELYDPNNFSNIYLGNYPDKQANPLINLLPNGRVLSAGGMTWTDGDLPFVYPARMCYIYDPEGVSSTEKSEDNIKGFKLYQNYPNPFNPITTIKYQLPVTSRVFIKIYNSLGKEITTLVSKTQMPGTHTLSFNAENLSSGVYFYQIITEKWTQTNKMLVLK